MGFLLFCKSDHYGESVFCSQLVKYCESGNCVYSGLYCVSGESVVSGYSCKSGYSGECDDYAEYLDFHE